MLGPIRARGATDKACELIPQKVWMPIQYSSREALQERRYGSLSVPRISSSAGTIPLILLDPGPGECCPDVTERAGGSSPITADSLEATVMIEPEYKQSVSFPWYHSCLGQPFKVPSEEDDRPVLHTDLLQPELAVRQACRQSHRVHV